MVRVFSLAGTLANAENAFWMGESVVVGRVSQKPMTCAVTVSVLIHVVVAVAASWLGWTRRLVELDPVSGMVASFEPEAVAAPAATVSEPRIPEGARPAGYRAPERVLPRPGALPVPAESGVVVLEQAWEDRVAEQRVAFEPAAPEVPAPRPGAGAPRSEPIRRIEVSAPATPPSVAYQAPVDYPRVARSRGIEGRVVVAVTITQSGGVDGITLVEGSGHSVLDRAAMASVRRWKFHPARRSGAPVAGRLEIPVIFELR